MIADSEGIGDDGECGIHSRARHEEATIDDVEIIEVVCFTVDVECGVLGVFAKADRSVLVADGGKWDFFPEVGVAGDDVVANADVVEHLLEFVTEPFVSFCVVVGVVELDLAFSGELDPVIGIGQVFGGEPEVNRVIGEATQDKTGGEGRRICPEHALIGFAEHLDVAERVVPFGRAVVKIVDAHRLLKAGRVGLSSNGDHG